LDAIATFVVYGCTVGHGYTANIYGPVGHLFAVIVVGFCHVVSLSGSSANPLKHVMALVSCCDAPTVCIYKEIKEKKRVAEGAGPKASKHTSMGGLKMADLENGGPENDGPCCRTRSSELLVIRYSWGPRQRKSTKKTNQNE
jgi:hypothetical protein